MLHEDSFSCETPGDGAVVDLSAELAGFLAAAPVADGLCCIAVSGSTCAVTTIEYEPGLVRDLGELLQRLVPRGPDYHHDARWGDGNGFSHLRAALVGPSITFAVVEGKPRLGTWQQPVLLDFDNRPRRREVSFSIVGDQAPERNR
ncbi:MAG: YjbQ family protein [Candidatus Coatesbacteria bacterium]|nr:YjbQ family protein [Candidatus Coatesbacteria bacterium]